MKKKELTTKKTKHNGIDLHVVSLAFDVTQAHNLYTKFKNTNCYTFVCANPSWRNISILFVSNKFYLKSIEWIRLEWLCQRICISIIIS